MTVRRALCAVFGLCAASAGAAYGQPARLGPGQLAGGAIEAEPPAIDVLTFGVGARIFEKFGHAAICLRYREPRHPTVCFNYGVTNFSAGAIMVWDFLRSQQKFWVEPVSFHTMFSFYQREDRDIWLQALPIAGEQARAIEAKLWSDIREDNRYYNYDHFFDNCTTRLRDMIDQASAGALRAGNDARYPLTFRELGRRGLAGMPILLVLVDLMIGRQTDDHPTVWQAMFHPDVLRQQIAARLGVEPRLLYKRRGPVFPVDGPSGRIELVALALGFTLPLVLAQWRRRFEAAALAWATLWLVALGALVWGLAIVSSIPAVRWNEAVLVATPLDLALPFLPAVARRRYALARIGLVALCSLLAAIGVFHQPVWVACLAVFPPLLAIALDVPNGLRARLGRSESASNPGSAAGPPAEPAAEPPAQPPAISAAQLFATADTRLVPASQVPRLLRSRRVASRHGLS
jgi:hypothetical protein